MLLRFVHSARSDHVADTDALLTELLGREARTVADLLTRPDQRPSSALDLVALNSAVADVVSTGPAACADVSDSGPNAHAAWRRALRNGSALDGVRAGLADKGEELLVPRL